MNDRDYYISVSSLAMNPAELASATSAEARDNWLCSGCTSVKPKTEALTVQLKNQSLEGPLNVTFGPTLAFAHKSFLFRLGEERVRRHLFLGEVYGPNGRRWDDWVTFRGRHRLIVRGTKDVALRVCPLCGANLYFSRGAQYLYPEPPTNIEIFESHLNGLIFPDYVGRELGIGGVIRRVRGAEILDWPSSGVRGKRSSLLVERLNVLAEPRDNLPPLALYAQDPG